MSELTIGDQGGKGSGPAEVPTKSDPEGPVSGRNSTIQEATPIDPTVRDAKMGLLRTFIRLTKDGQMDLEEAEKYIARVKGNGFITEKDVSILRAELTSD
jgi:hypothetical protein